VDQFPGMLEGGLHILLGERQRLFGDFRSLARNRRDRFVGGIEEQPERPLGLIDGLFGQIAKLSRHFQFRFDHGRHPPFFWCVPHFHSAGDER
jgi:hypothetical protein